MALSSAAKTAGPCAYFSMIVVQRSPSDENILILKANYYYRKRLHFVPGSSFDYGIKAWTAPIAALPVIEREFKGELYFKTPKWELEGKEEPPEQKVTLYGPPAVIPSLQLSPYPYQEDGIRFMVDRLLKFGFVLNSDYMGLGKTIQTIAAMKWFFEEKNANKFLIICKKSIKTQWEDEIRKFTGWTGSDMPVMVTMGSKAKRDKTYKAFSDLPKGVLITNYHNFLNDTPLISESAFDLCVVDEAHAVKARKGKMNNNIAGVTQKSRLILLTGTPVMSSPEDLYGLIQLADKEFFGSFRSFSDQYLVTDFNPFSGYPEIVGARNLDELQERIKAFTIRRMPEEVALQLPKTKPDIEIKVDMDATQKKMYQEISNLEQEVTERKKKILDKYGVSYSEKNPENIPAAAIAKIRDLSEKSKMYISALQFVSDDPVLFRERKTSSPFLRDFKNMVPKSYVHSPKTEALYDLAEDIAQSGEKLIIFCHFRSTAVMLKDVLMRLPCLCKDKGALPVAMYTGAESDDIREQNVNAFKTDDRCQILIGTDAAAEGLNLQVAKFMIHFEQPDTYAQKVQRNGRIRRIGSKHEYIVIYDIISSDSFDQRKIEKLEKDKMVSESLLG